MVDATDAAPEPAVPQPQLLLPGWTKCFLGEVC